ncbi:hypothetical protein B0H14DRAFT_2390048, partial [Mycena olivaceomarginata]
VAGLQIQDPVTEEWKWVKPQDATLTVNTCDALQLLTGGYVRSTIHRVMPPPKDQQHVDRLGLLYFSRYVFLPVTYCVLTEWFRVRPHNDVKLATIQDSPVLQREVHQEPVRGEWESRPHYGRFALLMSVYHCLLITDLLEWTFAKQNGSAQDISGPSASKEVLPGFPRRSILELDHRPPLFFLA